jgi:hypothetical protein
MADAASHAIELWKRWVPRRHQQLVLEARVAARRRADPERPLPDFLVIGAQRSGTSSLYKYLEQHPCVLSSLRKETEYFSSRWANGEPWYRAHFPSRRRRSVEQRRRGFNVVTFEASPNYVFHPLAPARAAEMVPEAKLVVLLRNPVERALSHHQHEVRAGREVLSFEQAIDLEPERLAGEEERMVAEPTYRSAAWERFSYQARGRYAEQLERWMMVFPPERFLVLKSEDLYARPAACFGELLAFLGVPAWIPSEFRNHSYASTPPSIPPSLSSTLRSRLSDHFAAPNRQLSSLLGRDFGWE